MYDVASHVVEKHAMWKKRKKIAALTAALDPFRWKILTEMHSPINATITPL